MTKKVIAVDIDEVLQPFQQPFGVHHNELYGTNFIYPDVQGRYYLEEFTGESSAVVEEKLRIFLVSPAFDEIKPLPGAVQAVKKLKKSGYTLSLITARQGFFEAVTKRFLERYFAGLFAEVHFIPHFIGSALQPVNAKLAICQRIKASYLIDDNATTAITCAEAGIRSVLFGDYHWNKADKLPKGVTRCKDWPAVLEYFDARS